MPGLRNLEAIHSDSCPPLRVKGSFKPSSNRAAPRMRPDESVKNKHGTE